MKNKLFMILMLLSIILTACGQSESEPSEVATEKETEATEAKTETESESGTKVDEQEETESNDETAEIDHISVGLNAGGTNIELCEVAKDVLAEEGIELELVIFNDYNMPNEAVYEGSVDLNFIQHLPFLENYNASNGTDLVPVNEGVYSSINGIFSNKIDSLEEIEDGMTVAIPNDSSNRDQFLRILDGQGIITLKEGIDIVSLLDIEENPYNLEFTELDMNYLIQAINDFDVVCSHTNKWVASGGSIDDLIYQESLDVNLQYVVTRNGEEDSPKAQKFHEAITSDEVKQYMEENLEGLAHINF